MMARWKWHGRALFPVLPKGSNPAPLLVLELSAPEPTSQTLRLVASAPQMRGALEAVERFFIAHEKRLNGMDLGAYDAGFNTALGFREIVDLVMGALVAAETEG